MPDPDSGDRDTEFIEDESSNESVDDLGHLKEREVSNAVVWSTDWTTETIVSQINKNNILLYPGFQRRDAWENQRKSRFIESLILGLPIPQIVLAESEDSRGSYIVIDGKQRLLSIRQFAAEKDDSVFDRLRLSGLTVRTDLQGLSLSDLRDNLTRSRDLAAFENQSIRTVVIKNWRNENFLYQVFLRLNTGSVPLSPQELRQALHPGGFVEFADAQSGRSPALRSLLKINKPDFRMRDAELLIRFYAFQNYAEFYSGDLKGFLDLTCKDLNKRWKKNERGIISQAIEFEEAYQTSERIFSPDTVFRKWTFHGYERPFNRAIFDIMMYFFAKPQIRAAAVKHSEQVEAAFKQLCDGDINFLSSLERTTKSMRSTETRFGIWAQTLGAVLGMQLVSPIHQAQQ